MRQLISLPIIISAALLAATITTAHAGSGAIAASMSNDGVIRLWIRNSGGCRTLGHARLPRQGRQRLPGIGDRAMPCPHRQARPYVTGYSIYTAYSREARLGGEQLYIDNATVRATGRAW